MKQRKPLVKVPSTVLERAQQASAKKPLPPPAPRPSAGARTLTKSKREKVIAALKKLHPMD